MRGVLLLVLLAASGATGSQPVEVGRRSSVTLLHISDYHSHALPFYTDEGERGGIARAIGFLREQKRNGALVFSGGDTINKGSPAWSDKYGCAEWAWFNGVLDAMAFGNHDADYGFATLQECRATTRYPILSANTSGFRGTHVLRRRGVRIGVFAVAGDDFPQLVKDVPQLKFTDPIEAARAAVKDLRERGQVDVVVMIGHQHAEDDYALAKTVPGIDLIFGSHSHLKRELTRIPGTDTWYISPSQYLTYISRVEVTIEDLERRTLSPSNSGGLRARRSSVLSMKGALIPVDEKLAEDVEIAKRVSKMQNELEQDLQYSALFRDIGKLDTPLSMNDLARRALETMRTTARADVALSTTSSVRGSLAAGRVTLEELRAAMPYDNEIVACRMTAPQLQRVLDFNKHRQGTDAESAVAGKVDQLDPDASYRVATTDYLAFVAYKEVFSCDVERTRLRVRDEVRKTLTASPSP
ncbi:MAG TPA: bifunctional metallophosphatase/5'-nucleotidase [Thermoanaerobaculia bacterium]|nr:bifunctional metallophosphatase/5'-nucleotidase [Thermoanaerobaculia bacterium]